MDGTSGKPPAEEEGAQAGFQVGRRVHSAGDPRRCGTVRYVGPVVGQAGAWVGVDWDDGQGKHDGSVAGTRYFTANGECSGSLVRAKNLSAGVSFLEALRARYRSDSTEEEKDEMYVLSTKKRHVSIQLVGKDKVQRKLSHLEEWTSASISYLGVSSIEPPQETSVVIPNLKELDLTGNLLSRWQDIGSICEALPALEILNLTNNLMECDVPELPFLQSIRILVLNNCGVTWEQVEKLKLWLPAVEELHLMANKLRTVAVTTFVEGFDSLRLLNLEDNCFEEWNEILKLSQLKSLEQLHLNKNSLEKIYYPDRPRLNLLNDYENQENCPRPFEKLQCLLLGRNKIDDLASIDSLNFFPSLVDIRLSENPIVDPARGGVPRFVLVACLAKVKILNGSEVSPRERKESEIRYVRLVMAKLCVDKSDKIENLHPRFAELKKLHGIDDEKPSTGTAGPQKMASGLLNITLKCVGPSIGEKPPITKKLPPTTTVGKLKVLCESFFKLKGVKPRLFIQEEGSPLPQLLHDDMSSLVDLGIGTEATILIDEES